MDEAQLKKLVLGLLLIFFGFVLLVIGKDEQSRYREAKENAVTVTAEVYTMTYYHDPDDSTDYETHAKYEYEGKTYTYRYGEYRTEEAAKKTLGLRVDIEINPQVPKERLTALKQTSGGGVTFGWIQLILGILLLVCSFF